VGEQDEDVTPEVYDAHTMLVEAGADVTLETIPGAGHDFPANFGLSLPGLLESLLVA
jgi:hypothetical protein